MCSPSVPFPLFLSLYVLAVQCVLIDEGIRSNVSRVWSSLACMLMGRRDYGGGGVGEGGREGKREGGREGERRERRRVRR